MSIADERAAKDPDQRGRFPGDAAIGVFGQSVSGMACWGSVPLAARDALGFLPDRIATYIHY
ncbi:MAG: hypothetical protein MZV64_01700 [Ignavibacteriales bacterium]|nr:hypothetical protein [Ignavibacteriales bacterium]